MEKETVGQRLAKLALLPMTDDSSCDGNLYCFEVPIDADDAPDKTALG